MYVKITNGVPEKYTIGKLRKDNPNISFPKNIPDERLAEYDVYPYVQESPPVYDPLTQRVELGAIVNVDGVWTEQWAVIDKTAEQIQQETDARAEEVRQQRDAELQATDWVVIRALELGNPIPAEVVAYRQTLRDLPANANFPDVALPVKPKTN